MKSIISFLFVGCFLSITFSIQYNLFLELERRIVREKDEKRESELEEFAPAYCSTHYHHHHHEITCTPHTDIAYVGSHTILRKTIEHLAEWKSTSFCSSTSTGFQPEKPRSFYIGTRHNKDGFIFCPALRSAYSHLCSTASWITMTRAIVCGYDVIAGDINLKNLCHSPFWRIILSFRSDAVVNRSHAHRTAQRSTHTQACDDRRLKWNGHPNGFGRSLFIKPRVARSWMDSW